MRIYLADLFHVWAGNRNTLPYTVPLGIGFLAAALRRRIPGMDLRLFRDPDQFLETARAEPPALLGLSFTSWNMDISHRVAQWVKLRSPQTIIVGGGPCVDDQDEQLLAFFSRHPEIDYLIPNEGEDGFVSLVAQLAAGSRKEGFIPGVAYLDSAGELVRGKYRLPDLAPAEHVVRIEDNPTSRPEEFPQNKEIPSPYLDGTLDPFLREGLVPIIQTMRGCPYRCEFCVSGTTLWNKPRPFPLERVEAEIDYALSRTRSKDLILTDENWGILGQRDVELAKFIVNRHKAARSPARLYYYTAKVVNDAVREIVELVSPIAWIGEFTMSFQSLNPDARKAIRRTNIPLEKLAANVHWANERNIPTSSEMIFPFPHETVDSFIEGIETLLRAGINRIAIFPLQLFPGIDLATNSARTDYGFTTRFRLNDCSGGAYLKGEIVSVESEEIVIATKWLDSGDYLKIRRYGLFHMLLWRRGYFEEFSRLSNDAGISLAGLGRFLATEDLDACPALKAIIEEFELRAIEELKPTHEDVVNSVAGRLKNGENVEGMKLNLVYLGRLLSTPAAVQELFDLIDRYISGMTTRNSEIDVVRAYLHEVLPHLIVILGPSVTANCSIETHFDYQRWRARDYCSLTELLSAVPLRLDIHTPIEIVENLSNFDKTDAVSLQRIFDDSFGKRFLRTVAKDPQSIPAVQVLT